MSDLVEFLRARLDEDEQAAKLVRQPYRLYVSSEGRISEPKLVDDFHGERDGEYEQWADGEDRMPNHITNWTLIYDPARALREVESKRRILDKCAPSMVEVTGPWDIERQFVPGEGAPWAEPVLRDLAATYSDHDGYREEWRP